MSFEWVDLNMSNGNVYDSNSHQTVRTLQIKANLIKVHDLQERTKILGSFLRLYPCNCGAEIKRSKADEIGMVYFLIKGEGISHELFGSTILLSDLGVCCFTYSQRTRAPVT